MYTDFILHTLHKEAATLLLWIPVPYSRNSANLHRESRKASIKTLINIMLRVEVVGVVGVVSYNYINHIFIVL